MPRWLGKAVLLCMALGIAGGMIREATAWIRQNAEAAEAWKHIAVLWGQAPEEDTETGKGPEAAGKAEDRVQEEGEEATADKKGDKGKESTGAEIRRIALTFDDGPHPSYTEELLDGLKERGVHASFFVLGEHAQLHPEIIRRMQEEGHLIGNHTYSHMQLKDCNWAEYREELIKTNQVLRELTGEEIAYIRPPYGCWDKSFEEELNMFPVLWSVDTLDT